MSRAFEFASMHLTVKTKSIWHYIFWGNTQKVGFVIWASKFYLGNPVNSNASLPNNP